MTYREPSARQDKGDGFPNGFADPSHRPDREAARHSVNGVDIVTETTSASPATDTTNWDVVNHTGNINEPYPSGHNEQHNGASGAGPA